MGTGPAGTSVACGATRWGDGDGWKPPGYGGLWVAKFIFGFLEEEIGEQCSHLKGKNRS